MINVIGLLVLICTIIGILVLVPIIDYIEARAPNITEHLPSRSNRRRKIMGRNSIQQSTIDQRRGRHPSPNYTTLEESCRAIDMDRIKHPENYHED